MIRRGLRVEIDLNKIRENSAWLVKALGRRGVTITGVTKSVRGNPAVARAMLQGGITQLADSRISNIYRMRMAGLSCPITMLRSPLANQIKEVIKHCEISYNSDLNILNKLSNVASDLDHHHGVVIMLEMGDGRDGLMPEQLPEVISVIKNLPSISLMGIATNSGCLSGEPPSINAMLHFADLILASEKAWSGPLESNSNGGSSALTWAFSPRSRGRNVNLRLGESIFLGSDPLTLCPIEGLHQDAVSLFAEVMESSPTDLGLASPKRRDGSCARLVLAIGNQDTDIKGLGSPSGIQIIGSTSDHMVVHSQSQSYKAGSEIKFSLNYSAFSRAMNSCDVETFVFDNASNRTLGALQ